MTRRTIITADGTRLRDDSATRRLIRRCILGILAIIGLIFFSAAVIGITHPATHSAPKTDNSVESFNDGWNTGLQDIMDIASTPTGKARIDHCLQITQTADSFHTCISG